MMNQEMRDENDIHSQEHDKFTLSFEKNYR